MGSCLEYNQGKFYKHSVHIPLHERINSPNPSLGRDRKYGDEKQKEIGSCNRSVCGGLEIMSRIPSTGVNDTIKTLISSLYVLTPLIILAYSFYSGESVDSIILFITVLFMFASAYVIYGEEIIDKSTEKAEEVTGEGEEKSEEEEE